MPISSAVYGCLAERLSPWEKAFFRDSDPWGLILFRRNAIDPEQIKALTSEFREAVGRDAPVLVDQEGGRVARLRGEHWRDWGPPLALVESGLAQHEVDEALYLRYRWIGAELRAAGIDVNCVPLLDIPADDSHEVIGDRALGRDPETVAGHAAAVYQALRASGVMPVIKHLPGHGRTDVDSHLSLPVVCADAETLRQVDFAPFKRWTHAPIGMSAHVVYTAFDSERPATQSHTVIGQVIRGEIGFKGLLLTDDLSMEALSGDLGQRAALSLAAGCDIALHCNGDPDEMVLVAEAARPMTGQALTRLEQAEAARIAAPAAFDFKAADSLLRGLAKKAGLDRV